MKKIGLLLLCLFTFSIVSCVKTGEKKTQTPNSYDIVFSVEKGASITFVMTIMRAEGDMDLDFIVDGQIINKWRYNDSEVNDLLGERTSQTRIIPTRKHAEPNQRVELGKIDNMDSEWTSSTSLSVDLTIEFYRTKNQLAIDLYDVDITGDGKTGITLNDPVPCKIHYSYQGETDFNFTVNGEAIN